MAFLNSRPLGRNNTNIWIYIVFAASALTAQSEADSLLQADIDATISQAPVKIDYTYTLESAEDNFKRTTEGTLFILGTGIFRVTLWDKVYGSDGTSLYLHDLNTRQTIVDSLRWSELNLWVRLLQGHLPAGSKTAISTSGEDDRSYILVNMIEHWRGELKFTGKPSMFQTIEFQDAMGWEHKINLQSPSAVKIKDRAAFISLEDLPGKRLDLRN